jgi:hypothetical protein
MEAQKQIVAIDRHVWTLKSPAHYTEIDKAVGVANQERNQLAASGTWAGDVFLSGDDQHVIVSFDARHPETPAAPSPTADASEASSV